MSLLAGFDLVSEISNETVRELIEQNLQIGGVSLVPTFELTLPVSGGGASGSAHLMVNSLEVDLNSNDTITVTLGFEKTSVMIHSPLPLTICPLDGTIAITAAITLVNAGSGNKQISLKMSSASVAITYSSQANAQITSDLSGTPITPATFKSLAMQAVASIVQSVPSPTIPMAFHVVSGTDGSLSPHLQFEKLEVHCIPNAHRNQQALGIFGILLKANHSHGNHNDKTSTAITANHDGMCVSISAEAFHSLVFCPAIAAALGTTESHLPPSCGGSSFDTQGVTVNSISDSFATGHINLDGSVSKSGFCYDANGTFHGTIKFTASGSTLTPVINMGQPDVDVDIPWYCWIVAGVVLGPLGLVLAGVVDGVAGGIASSLAGAALSNALGGGLPGIGLGALGNASFSDVNITTAGLTLQGTVPVIVNHPFVLEQILLDGTVVTTGSFAAASGIWHTKVWCMEEAKDYPYTDYVQTQTGTYAMSGVLVIEPLTPHFRIQTAYDNAVYHLNGSSGTIVIQNMPCHYPMPLATGGTSMIQDVHVNYTISGTTLQLSNQPGEGNYHFDLWVKASDCSGHTLKDHEGNEMEALEYVQFEGEHMDIGGGYTADVQYCGSLLQQWFEQISQEYAKWQYVPKWVMVDFPPPDQLIQYFRDLASIGKAVTDEVLVQSKIAHGNSFYRAIFSPAATQPNLLNAGKAAAAQTEIAAIAQQIAALSDQLAKANTAQTSAQTAER